MSLNPGQFGESHNWNYSKPDKDGYSLTLTGTVVAIQEAQAMKFGADGMPTQHGEFWPDGNAKMNIRMVLVGPKGGYRTWTFTPAGKAAREGKKKSVHLDLFALAGGKDMLDIIGKTIRISTVAPPAGFSYGVGNPRPWTVELVNEGPYQLTEELDPIYRLNRVLADTAVSGGTMNPPVVVHPDPMVPQESGTEVVATPAPQPEVSDEPPF